MGGWGYLLRYMWRGRVTFLLRAGTPPGVGHAKGATPPLQYTEFVYFLGGMSLPEAVISFHFFRLLDQTNFLIRIFI